MKKKLVILIVVVIVIALYIIVKCLPNEQARVKQDINAFAKAVEQENKRDVLSYIDEMYIDNHGVDYEVFVNNLAHLFNTADSIRVKITGLEINIDSADAQNIIFASCSLGLKIFARYQGDRVLIFGGFVKPNPVRAFFKKTDETNNHYKVYTAEY
ncbi:MAG: hypothetical protein WBB67_01420 [bacterium]